MYRLGVICIHFALLGMVLAPSGVTAQGQLAGESSPSDHLNHHPSSSVDTEPGAAENRDKKGTDSSSHGQQPPGSKSENMMGMMEGMEKMGAAQESRPLFPAIIRFQKLTRDEQAAVKTKAENRQANGWRLIVDNLDKIKTMPDNDPALLKNTITDLREGIHQYESGWAAQRALKEDTAQVTALNWFRKELNLVPSGVFQSAGGPPLSIFHLFVMAILAIFFVLMCGIYFFKMRRATQLIQDLVNATAPDAAKQLDGVRKWSGKLQVACIFQEKTEVKTFRLINADGGPIPFTYLPGQFLPIMIKDGDKVFKRFYTLCSSPTQKYYCEITVRRVAGGMVSTYLHDHIKEEDLLNADAPSGKFIFTGHESGNIVMIGGGVGITPLMGVLRYLIDTCWDGEVYFLYACKSLDRFIFREELEYLRKRHAHLHIRCFIDALDAELEYGQEGKINKDELIRFVPDITSQRIRICGPPGFMGAITDMLRELGVPRENIRTEAFARGQPDGKPLAMEAADLKGAPTVNFQKSRKSAPIPKEATILEVADHVGVDIDNSCRAGICGLCKVKLLSGRVDMETDDALDTTDKKEGLILACQAKAKNDITVDA